MKTKKFWIIFALVTMASWFIIAYFMETGTGTDAIKFWDMPSGIEKFMVGYLITLMSCLPGAVMLLVRHFKRKRELMGW